MKDAAKIRLAKLEQIKANIARIEKLLESRKTSNTKDKKCK